MIYETSGFMIGTEEVKTQIFKMADERLTDNSIDFSKLKVPDLKKELKQRGLSTAGNKTELIERLQSALKNNENIGSESVDDLEEDLLNEDDDEHIDTNESVILENDLDESPNINKRKIEDTSPIEVKQPKKVVLNRNNINFGTDNEEKIEETIVKTITADAIDKNEEKKVIKLSDLTAKERLEMRAKKFGVTALSVDAKRAARAERFGTTSSSSITSSKVVSRNKKIVGTLLNRIFLQNTSVDILKQRAARFGGSVSSTMSNLENKEKLEKRKQRFGSVNGVPENDKAQIRLERFKQLV
ncbi:SAP domain-containing ribonucleoprotein isoform X1 [Diorhabda sublineata]|uniref:SAP domain-containing ribonucleoprotein isoform X1 n=1 Tax=Diorhabda sublineata TaxID=1163346 RepID=UPI0024E18ADB|nr:SAP domain-containing ribonucleoprotein isoform X1 [Diorhabda sublineata]